MKIGVALVAFNRREMFRRCVESLRAAEGNYALTVVELDSCDGTADLARRFHETGMVDRLILGERPSVLYESYLQGIDAYLADPEPPDGFLLTAEDYVFRPDWRQRLDAWLFDAPPGVSHASAELEPDFPWNRVSGVLDCGGVRALVRHTAPGASWAMTLRSWRRMEPVFRANAREQHLDTLLNAWARRQGLAICALDVAEHVGAECSLVGNDAFRLGKPLDRARWGV